eukprot:1127165-Rhodomonas_salina.2
MGNVTWLWTNSTLLVAAVTLLIVMLVISPEMLSEHSEPPPNKFELPSKLSSSASSSFASSFSFVGVPPGGNTAHISTGHRIADP